MLEISSSCGSWAARMKVNKEKSELFYTGQIEGKAGSLADLLECSVGTLSTKYLGEPSAACSMVVEVSYGA